jgi:hypothetical protein
VVLWRRFLDTPTEEVHWVVTVPHYILKKLFYFGRVLGDVIVSFNKLKKLFSFYYNVTWKIVYTIYFRDLDNLLHMHCMVRFFYFVSFFLSFSPFHN